MLEVYFVQWAVGLNPYNYLQECYGGAPELFNVNMADTSENQVSLVFPDAAIFHGDVYDKYIQV